MQDSHRRPSLTENPWFWLTVFGGMGVLGIVVIGPKYALRMARVERMQDARERVAAERARDALATTPTTPKTADHPPVEPYLAEDRKPPARLLWLLGLMAALLVIGAAGLLHTRRGLHSHDDGIDA